MLYPFADEHEREIDVHKHDPLGVKDKRAERVAGDGCKKVVLCILQLVHHLFPQGPAAVGITGKVSARPQGIQDSLGSRQCGFMGVGFTDVEGTPAGKLASRPC